MNANKQTVIHQLQPTQQLQTTLTLTILQWRQNEINIVGARRGPKDRNLKPKGLSQGHGFLERGLTVPSPTIKGFAGEL